MSEFGKGLSYCLGLFLAHADRNRGIIYEKDISNVPSFEAMLWFSGASDHLYELETDYAPESIKNDIVEFKERCLDFGHGGLLKKEPSFDDVDKAISEAKYFLLQIDLANKIPAEVGDFQ